MYFILSTFPNQKDARKVARKVVEKRLAGCALTMPVDSCFLWEGKMQNENEVLVVFKTTKTKAKKLMKFIEERHPCEVPFVAAFSLGAANPVKNIFNGVNKKYLAWIEDVLK